jgi:hypothetical protein
MSSILSALFRLAFLLVVAVTPFWMAQAYIPVQTTNDNQVYWHLDERGEDVPNVIEGSIEFFINRFGTPDIPDQGNGEGGEFEVFRKAFRAWEKVPYALADFNDLRLTDQTLLSPIDQTNFSGLFPVGTGVIALTLLSYEDEEFEGIFDGRIVDADLVFNGRDFTYGENGEIDRMDLQSVATHEIGHILGLDHSFHQHIGSEGCCVNVPAMFPFLQFGDIRTRTLKRDDLAGLISSYPNPERNDPVHGSISGRVIRATNTDEVVPLEGIEVVAYRDDEPMAGAMTRTNGVYRIFGLPEGAYTLRCMGVSEGNLSLPFVPETDFRSEWYPAAGLSSDASPITVIAGRRRFSYDFELPLASEAGFFESNDATTTATLAVPDGPRMIQQFHQLGDEDWIRFNANRGTIYELMTDNLEFFANPYMELYEADGRTLSATNDDIDAAVGNFAARIVFAADRDGTYFVRLTDSDGFFGGGTSFEFAVRAIGLSSEFDANGDGVLDSMDLLSLGTQWGQPMSPAKAYPVVVNEELLLDVLGALRSTP